MDSEKTSYKPLIYWLIASSFMIFVMVIIGAITRLTESGLSMVEWRPLMGALPPMGETEWQRVYELYKQSPEFEQKHHWMALDDFKNIFFWEWFHRLWGRLIGFVYVLPLIWFWVRNQIPAVYKPRLFVFFILGGLQGVLGWWMVKSGLVDRPDVSHFRLAAHLSLALIIYSALIWTIFDLRRDELSLSKESAEGHKVHKLGHAYGSLALLVVTIIWGAFVAGLDAGRIYNTFPFMDGSFLPSDVGFSVAALIHEHSWVQFVHRWIAILAAAGILTLALRHQDLWLGGMVFLQVGLGITTLLTQVSLHPAVTHQAGAVILLSLVLYRIHIMKTENIIEPQEDK